MGSFGRKAQRKTSDVLSLMSIGTKIFIKYGSCMIETNNFITRYFYQGEDLKWIQVCLNDL